MNFTTMKQKHTGAIDSYLLTTEANKQKILNNENVYNNIDLNLMKAKLRSKLEEMKAEKPTDLYVIEWLTEDGWKSNGNVSNDINTLLADPSEKKYVASGNENNALRDKEIYGVRITALKVAEMPWAAVPMRQEPRNN